MRVDVHTHIFPPKVVADRSRFFAGEPAFEQLYNSPKAKLVGAEALIEAMDQAAVDYAVTFGFPWLNSQQAQRHNDYILEAAAKFAPRLVPLACMHPLAADAVAEAERCLRAGARGLGELAVYETCDEAQVLRRYRDLADCCRGLDALMLVHANEPVGHAYPGKAPMGLRFYYELARACSPVPLILAHWGGGLCFYELLKKETRKALAHVRYDTAASPYLYRSTVYPLLTAALGAEKILFGSDYPLLAPPRYFKEMEQSGLNARQIAAIGGNNAAALLGLG